MLVNIRKAVFETNSSSTHSISICEDSKGILDTIVPDDSGTIVLEGGQFGWEWKKYNDSLTKANYCAVFAFEDAEQTNMLVELLTEHTGAKAISVLARREDYSSYIDHQSAACEGGAAKEVFKSKDSLKKFIFSRDSWLFTGNDNEQAPPNFYDNTDEIYTHDLVVEGSDETVKFTHYPSIDEILQALNTLMDHHYLVNNYNYKKDYYNWEYRSFPYGGRDDIWSISPVNIGNEKIEIYQIKTLCDKDNKYIGESVVRTRSLFFLISKI